MSPWSEKKRGWLSDYRTKKEERISPDQAKSEETPQSEYAVFYIPLRCPKCRSKDVKCHTSSPPVRYHFCRKCGLRFKSIEK